MNGKVTIEQTTEYDEEVCPRNSDEAQIEMYRSMKPDNTVLYVILGALAGIVVALLLK